MIKAYELPTKIENIRERAVTDEMRRLETAFLAKKYANPKEHFFKFTSALPAHVVPDLVKRIQDAGYVVVTEAVPAGNLPAHNVFRIIYPE